MTLGEVFEQVDKFFEGHVAKTLDQMRSNSVDEEIIDTLENHMRAEYRIEVDRIKTEIQFVFLNDSRAQAGH